MRRTCHFLPTIVLLAATAACSRSDAASADGDLQRDLEQVSETGLELAPRGTGTEVMSAAEMGRTPPPPPTPGPRIRPATVSVERLVRGNEERGKPVAGPPVAVPAPTEGSVTAPVPDTATVPAAPRPAPVKPTRKGPYKTMEEVIRDAPFPIKP